MRLNPSWLTHFTAFGGSDAANANMALFGEAMDAQKLKMEKINNLIEDDDTLTLITGKDRKIKALHSFKKLRGTRIRPNMKLICLFGSGAQAYGIVIDSDKITESKEITRPTANVLWECSTINELENVKNRPPIMTPATTLCRSGQGRTNANGTGEEEVKTVTPKFLLQH
jgi:hypothetical protein